MAGTNVPTLWDSKLPDDEPTWTVAELSEAIEGALRQAFPKELWLRGEIRNLKRGQRMVWFDLVEPKAGKELGRPAEATLPVVLFDLARRQVNARLRLSGGAVRMEDGTEVRIRGRLGWWSTGGKLQLSMTDIDPEFTLGRLAADRDRLLRKLDAEGLLRAQAGLRLPEVPLRLGLVTSTASAAEQDVLDELRRSGIGFHVTKAGVRVQGKEAPGEIVRGLRSVATRDVELVLLVRGGGATTDLAAFDSETVARAIAGLGVPVLTGIGHEIDRTVSDEVAHTSYKTPTACAQGVVSHVRSFVVRLDTIARHIAVGIRHGLASADRDLEARTARLARSAQLSLTRSTHHVDRASGRVEAGARVHLTAETRRLDGMRQRLLQRAPLVVDLHRRHLDTVHVQVQALDPARALARGWSITQTADGALVRSPDDVAVGDRLVTVLAGGELRSTVDSTTVGGGSTLEPDGQPAPTRQQPTDTETSPREPPS